MKITRPLLALSILIAASPLTFAGMPEAQLAFREGRYIQAISELTPLVQNNDSDAEFMLAHIYSQGLAVPVDYERANDLYSKSAKHGNEEAQYQIFKDNEYKTVNTKKALVAAAQMEGKAELRWAAAFESVLAKAEQGDPASQLQAGKGFLNPYGNRLDKPRGIALVTNAAESGYADAQYELGFLHSNYKGISDLPVNIVEANRWWAMAADQYRAGVAKGDLRAARMLGVMYSKGLGVHVDPQLAALATGIADGEKGADWSTNRDLERDRIFNALPEREKQRVNELVEKWTLGTLLPEDMRGAVCDGSDLQPNFDATLHRSLFADFQKRLRMSVDAFRHSNGLANVQTEQRGLTELHRYFAESVATGPKGDSLLKLLASPPPRGIVSPLAIMLENVMNSACPVGFGGTFKDDGHDVELWYVDLNPDDTGALEAFKSPVLPAYGSLTRNTFPAMVFVRGKDERLEWYSLSMELDRILRYGVNVQLQ